jgi:hypothetical protein
MPRNYFSLSELLSRYICCIAKASFLFEPGGVSFVTLVFYSLLRLIELFGMSPFKGTINVM